MIKRRKRLMAKVLVLAMCASMVSATIAFADDTNTQTFTQSTAAVANFSFDSTTGTITAYTGNDAAVVIPSTIGGVTVTKIGEKAFEGCSSITSITIPNTIKDIGKSAFNLCINLKSVTIPGSVEKIGFSAFMNCKSLVSVTASNGLTDIGSDAFRDCSKLSSVTIPDSVTILGSWAFSGCSSLASITIPNSVTRIQIHTFDGCTSLTSIAIPDSAIGIGDYAFYNCTSLTSVKIPNSVTYIGYDTFRACKNAVFHVGNEQIKDSLTDTGRYMIGVNPIDPIKVIVDGQSLAVKVASITLNTKNLNLAIGQTTALTATVSPSDASEKGVIWETDSSGTATVDKNGNVTGMGVGIAKITCTSKDGTKKFDTCTVIVTKGTGGGQTNSSTTTTGGSGTTTPTPTTGGSGTTTTGTSTDTKVTGITVNGSDSIATKGGTLSLTTSITPDAAVNKNVTWTSSNVNIADVSSNGLVTAKANGSVTITATAADGSNISGNKVITVTGQTTTSSTSSNSALNSVYISGTEEVGHKLKAKVSYSGIKPSLDYQWQRASSKDGYYSDISGADEEEYKLKSSDKNKYIKVIVTATINGTKYEVGDRTSKIDRDTSNDDEDNSDTSSISTSSTSSSTSNYNYYYNGNGPAVLKITPNINNSQSFMKPSALNINSTSISTSSVFTNPSGHPVSGWINVSNNWYYLNNNGMPKVGWIQDNGQWYYLDQSGVMIRNTIVEGYTLGSDGAML